MVEHLLKELDRLETEGLELMQLGEGYGPAAHALDERQEEILRLLPRDHVVLRYAHEGPRHSIDRRY